MATAPTRLWIIDDLDNLPDGRIEVWGGELHEMPASGGQHSKIAADILTLINVFNRELKLGIVTGEGGGYVLSRDPLVLLIPDVAFVSASKAAEAPTAIFEISPDLVVEVVSPTDRLIDVDAKVRVYLSAGVSLVWVVLPGRRVVVVHSAAEPGLSREFGVGDVLDGGDVLPGLRLPVTDIFG
jgi:Uma2 family endonuclease